MLAKRTQNEFNPPEVDRNQKVQMTRKVKTAVAAAAVMMMLATLAPGEANAWGPNNYPHPGQNCPSCGIYNHNETLILDVD